ncbi:hypothetical protein Hypma_012896 [Hypsizygus marmoreus]|uniref:Thioredoxin-like fold domain-containing protein n=1 Tax=Hypsizygus marmoreus TaxID=39966 RepID=A0A369JCF8_HYPMA|nr:hypothetical protein Hypma_012896 [Hypsizygus marmoreus]
MRFSVLSLAGLAFAASVNAQYFSKGWAPGQPKVRTEDAPPAAAAQTSIPQKEAAPSGPLKPSGIASYFDLGKILSSQPSVALFSKLGINITEKLEGAYERAKIWDERVPLITDDNFQELIVNEPLTEQEEKDRTWVIVITVSSSKQDGISRYVDETFDTAFNETVIAGDLPNVRWGRIDYFNVTGITTKWAVWNAPYLVILRDRGQTLRFYKSHQLRLRSSAMRKFLEHEDWKMTPPWTSPYAPGGDREFIMTYLAFALTKIYTTFLLIPRWLLFVISGSVASFLINFLHKPGAQAPQPIQQQAGTPAPAAAEPPKAESSAVPAPQTHKRKRAKGKGSS